MKKQNVQKGSIEEQIEIIKETGVKPRLLLQACCGPCATSVLEYLVPYFDITAYYYNPNTMPKEEFIRRLDSLKVAISHFDGVKLIVPEQDESEFTSLVKGHEQDPEGGERCGICFALRLGKTAEYVASHKNEYDFFATTLTVSPYKNHKRINEIGEKIAEQYGVKYLSSNFKKRDGFLRSCRLADEFGLYQQVFCGCVYSKYDNKND